MAPTTELAGVCPTRYALTMGAASAGAIMDALKSHSAECAACGSTRKTVVSDRELLDAGAVCCEGKAAWSIADALSAAPMGAS